MKKLIASVLAGLMVIAVTPVAMGQTTFIANSFYAAGSPLSQYPYIQWAKRVEDLSNGDLKPNLMIGTVLLEPRASLKGVQEGVAQVANMPAMYTPSAMPVANTVQQLGFVLTDPLAAIYATTDFSMHNPVQLKEWKDLNIVYMGSYVTPPYILMCRKPVRNLDEIKGKRLRTAGSEISNWVKSVGAVPVNVPSSEMYTGLDRGTLDCATNAANDLIDRSLWEVAKYVTMLPTGFYYAGPLWGYNESFWASLSPKQRRTLMKASAYSMGNMTIHYLANAQSAIKKSKEKGVHFYEPSEGLKDSVVSYRKKVLANAAENAKKKFHVDNAQEILDAFMDKYKKWEKLLQNVDRNDPDALAKLAEKEIYDDIDFKTYGVY